MIDHNGFDRTFPRFEFESQLFLNRGEKRWPGNVIAGQTGNPVQMDIEGFELEALAGAAEVIRRCRPILAVTVYHHGDHLWKVPLAIAQAANPEFEGGAHQDYSFFLRSYQSEFWETVCYAVPRGRRQGAHR